MKLKWMICLIGAVNFLITSMTLIIVIIIAEEKQLLFLPEELVPIFAFLIGLVVSMLVSSRQ